MFANKHLFDDDGEVDVDDRGNADYQRGRPMNEGGASSVTLHSDRAQSGGSQRPAFDRPPTYDRAPSNLASSLGGGSSNLDHLPATPTPEMRKQKMDEQRRAQLDKRKQKAMAAPAVLRQNADQLQRQPSLAASPAASPSGGAAFQRQASYASSSAASSPPPYSSHDSDDEHDGIAPLDSLDPHMSSMLAQKRADQSRKHISQAERDMLSQGISPVFDPVKAPMSPGGPSMALGGAGFGFGSASSASSSSASSSSPVTSTCSAGMAKLDFSDMRAFLTSPIPKGVIFQCYILRNKKGLKNKLYPTYESYMSGEGERFLMAARKRTKNKTSNYMISMDKANQEKESPGYIGKVRSNFVGTEFVGYDRGCNPAEIAGIDGAGDDVRQETCAVFYESNILGSKGPRKMTAVVPTVRADGARAIWKPMTPEAGVALAYRRNPNGIEFMTLVNKVWLGSQQQHSTSLFATSTAVNCC